MRQLATKLVPGWPKLAWVARFEEGGDTVHVLHGPCIEGGDGWLCEAVWAGSFPEGDFDSTELVFGTGIRCRGGGVTFVSSGSMLDRIWHCGNKGVYHVSNSLPALLCCAGVSLREDCEFYHSDIRTMREGFDRYKRTIPADPCMLGVTYFHNLRYDGRQLVEIPKPDTAPDFECFSDYYGYMTDVARRLGANMAWPQRRNRVLPLTSISSGYDSGASAVIAQSAGCKDAVTIVNATSVLPRSDSGMKIAECLGITCRAYRNTPSAYRREEAVWAVTGRPAGLNLTVFDYAKPLCLYFSGWRGDSVWCRKIMERSEQFATPSIAGLGLCEFRLTEGLFHCIVPLWGARKARRIQAIGLMDEMEPWVLGNDYDRPIPRRILEQAGVPGRLFGRRKMVSSSESSFIWPFSRDCRESFASYLGARGLYVPPPVLVALLRKLAHLDHLVALNVTRKLTGSEVGIRRLFNFKAQAFLFQWANAELKQQYARGLASAGGRPQDSRRTT